MVESLHREPSNKVVIVIVEVSDDGMDGGAETLYGSTRDTKKATMDLRFQNNYDICGKRSTVVKAVTILHRTK